MQASNAPSKSAIPFAQNGTKNTIPEASQIGITPGLASFSDGFPPLTMVPLVAGGVPPYGADFNGILNFLSAAARWQQAGGAYPYDAAFSAAIGGYPQGAMLKKAAGSGYWLNLAENNATNPDVGGANWVALPAGIATTAMAQALADDTTAITPLKLGQVTALESRQGLVQLASMGQAQALADNTTAITPLRLGQVTALESRQGLVQLASMGQAQALTNDTTAITPLKLARAFEGNSSLGPAGYQKLPGGLIIQWGATPSVASGSFAGVTFPTTFPTAGVQMFATVAATSNLTESYSWATEIFSPSIGRVYHFGSSGQAATYRWFAIGY